MLGKKKAEILFVDIADDEDIDEIVCRFTCHIVETATHYEQREVMLTSEIFIQFAHCIETLAEDHTQVIEDRAGEIE